MNILQNVSLSNHSTMALGGQAAYLAEIVSREEIAEAVTWAKVRNLPLIMVGGGSNIIWQDAGFQGLVLVNKIQGYELQPIDSTSSYITIGAGENWDSVVKRAVDAGFTGIESLSLIPGTAGGTPVQNVGAYGQEIAQTLTTVEAFDKTEGKFVTLTGSDCGFDYRTSRFKTVDRGRFLISNITLQLTKGNPMPPFYGALQAYLETNNITEFTPATIRQAVINIRNSKLPDPAVVHNTGSFFANPVIPQDQVSLLPLDMTATPHWPMSNDSIKLSAAWLIEQAGFKDYHDTETGMATWPKQPLVLVNEKAKSTADLLAFKKKIVDAVQAKFGVTLEQEPEMLP